MRFRRPVMADVRLFMKLILLFACIAISPVIMAQSEICSMKELPDVEIFNPNKELIEELITAINSGESEYLSKNQGNIKANKINISPGLAVCLEFIVFNNFKRFSTV